MSRVLISSEDQYNLCSSAKRSLNCSWANLAKYLQVNPNTFEKWYRYERLLPREVFDKLIALDTYIITDYKLLPDNWGQSKGGSISSGIQNNWFGTLEGRKKGGKNSAKKFVKPRYSKDLAEFIGIMLGDGGIYMGQISITLSSLVDCEYSFYVTNLIKNIFKTNPSLYLPKTQNVIRICVSGVNLVRNLLGLGLIKGDKVKQQFDIPVWIYRKRSYIRSCIRGLIDTDGCVHRKVRRCKNGEYRSIGITFCSASVPLQNSVMRLFAAINFSPAISGRTIYICGKEQVTRYIKEIGSSNPKHINRYKSFIQTHGWVKVVTKIV